MTAPSNEHVDAGVDSAAIRDLYCLECGYNLRGQTGDPAGVRSAATPTRWENSRYLRDSSTSS